MKRNMAVPGTNSLLTDDEVQRALAEVDQLDPPDAPALEPPPPAPAGPQPPPTNGPQPLPAASGSDATKGKTGPPAPPAALNSPIRAAPDVVAIPVPAPQYSDRSANAPQPGNSSPSTASAQAPTAPNAPRGRMFGRPAALVGSLAAPLRGLLARVTSLLRWRGRRAAGGGAAEDKAASTAAAQAPVVADAEPAPAAETAAAPATAPDAPAEPVAPWNVRLHTMIESGLGRLDEPFAALTPMHKKLIGFAAITTIAMCLLSMLVLPMLFPRKDVIWFVQQKKAAMLAAPPPGAPAEGHGGGH